MSPVGRRISRRATILVALLLFASPSLASIDNVTSFGELGSFSNPAAFSRQGHQIASGNAYHIVNNNIIPALSFYSDLSGPYFRGSDAFATQLQNYEMNFGLIYYGFSYRLVEERDYVATGDTARAIQDIQNNEHMVGKSYEIGLRAKEEKCEYFGFTFGSPLKINLADGLWVGARVNLINGLFYQEGVLTGHASQVDSATMKFDFNLDADYSTEDTSGTGYSLDLGAICDINDSFSVEMIMENVAGEINWKNVSSIDAIGNSENIIVDPAGNIISRPTISGMKKVKEKKETLDFRSSFAGRYKLEREFALIGAIEPYTDLIYYFVGFESPFFGLCDIKAGYGSKYDTVSIGAAWQFFKLTLFANDISLSDATVLGLSLCATI